MAKFSNVIKSVGFFYNKYELKKKREKEAG